MQLFDNRYIIKRSKQIPLIASRCNYDAMEQPSIKPACELPGDNSKNGFVKKLGEDDLSWEPRNQTGIRLITE